jgi:heptosyltransferase-2
MTLLAHADARYRYALGPARLGELRMLGGRGRRPLPIPGRAFADEYARLLDAHPSRGPIEGHASLATLRGLPLPEGADAAPGVVLVPGGTRNVLRESALRRWPVERYGEVAARLHAAGHRITLVGDEGDAWVRPVFAGLPVHDAIGARSLPGTLALMARAELVITHDTGPLHLAALVRAPLLALFGPTTPSQFMPRYPEAEALWGGAHLACRPCYDGREFAACADNRCIQDLSVEAVVGRALARLAAATAGVAPLTPRLEP